MTSTPRFRRRRTRLLAVVTVAVLVALAIGVAAANRFAGPLPPRRLVMSTGREDGAYYDFGKQYRRVLAGHGFTLDLVPGAGSIETLTRLMAGTADVGFVQGGTAHAVDTSGLTALGGVFDEPVWVFHRRAVRVTDLSDLKGRRVAVGEPASGTRLLALQLLNDTGVTAANSTLRELPSDAVEAALLGDAVDAAFVVASPRAPLVHRLLAAPDLTLMSERRHLAYRTRHAFLTSVPIGEGVIDMARNIPPEDKVLLAARASLVVRDGIHPDLVRMLLFAADQVHRTTNAMEQAGRFPSESFVDLPLNDQAVRYLRTGPSWLERTFPFWVAGLLDRLVLIALPVAALRLDRAHARAPAACAYRPLVRRAARGRASMRRRRRGRARDGDRASAGHPPSRLRAARHARAAPRRALSPADALDRALEHLERRCAGLAAETASAPRAIARRP